MRRTPSASIKAKGTRTIAAVPMTVPGCSRNSRNATAYTLRTVGRAITTSGPGMAGERSEHPRTAVRSSAMIDDPLPPLDVATVDPEPMAQFAGWYDAAVVATSDRAAAMTVATATPDGVPSARVVLLRGFDERGLVFYTNYDSRKGGELAANPRAAAVLYWNELDAQVRVEGDVEHVDAAESD